MKANDAPEKIYLNWVNYPLEEMQVEYTRTDAFIKKACEWLINHNDYICCSTNGIVKYDMGKLVDDFKKYLEE